MQSLISSTELTTFEVLRVSDPEEADDVTEMGQTASYAVSPAVAAAAASAGEASRTGGIGRYDLLYIGTEVKQMAIAGKASSTCTSLHFMHAYWNKAHGMIVRYYFVLIDLEQQALICPYTTGKRIIRPLNVR